MELDIAGDVETEALFAIGIPALIVGGTLLILGRLWAKRWLRSHVNDPSSRRLGAASLGACGVFITFMLMGLASRIYAPDSAFAEFLNTNVGFLSWLGLGMLVYVIAEGVFANCGLSRSKRGGCDVEP